MKDSTNEAKRWFLQGMQDLDDARFNHSGKRYNVACFLAQQSAEKILKSYLLAQGVDHVWGHSTGELCQDAKKFDQGFSHIEIESKSLDKYYIPTRYPDALPGIIPSEAYDESDASKAIYLAEKIICFVESKSKSRL
jgi:HEPN domain-containing protein